MSATRIYRVEHFIFILHAVCITHVLKVDVTVTHRQYLHS